MRNERIGRHLLPGFLMRLLRDARGNTLVLIAAAVIPMAALAGSAIDIARFYVVKVRMQQACDAGVLAGRKFMDPNNAGPTLDSTAAAQAQSFFKNNYRSGWFGTSATTFTPTKTSDSQVAGTAVTTVPLTVMQMFGFGSSVLSVSCKARYDVADADIMFALDTTGSMGCVAADTKSTCDGYAVSAQQYNSDTGTYSVIEKPGSRLAAVRNAVLVFYDTVTASADPTTHFRYGFVPYSATANVGQLLMGVNPSYVADTANYQSRIFTPQLNGSATPVTTTTTKAACAVGQSQTAWTATAAQYVSTKTTTTWTQILLGPSGTCYTVTQPMKLAITYQQVLNVDTSKYKTFSPTVPNPADPNNANARVWSGCVEERDTTPNTTTFDPVKPPDDLAVDIAGSDATNDPWTPMWLDAEFWRNSPTSQSDPLPTHTYSTRASYNAWFYNDIPCPKAAQRLMTMSRDDVSAYVNDPQMRPFGVTYHDVGMTWATRLLAPLGLFGGDTTAWPGRQPPNRFIIFLTDGLMETSPTAYAAHGMEMFDKRVVGTGNINNLDAYHNARLATACTIAKNHNIKVFVIVYGSSATLDSNMTSCASPGQAYAAPTDAALKTTFQTIAQQVAMLRIDQ